MKTDTVVTKTYEYDSPSGSINITKLEPPFMTVEKGFGFVGVLAVDSKTGEIQCHLCGEWYKQLSSHLHFQHHISADEYKRRFGLFKATALVTMEMREHRSRVMLENRRLNKANRHLFSKKHPYIYHRKGKEPAERQNRAGVCELQVAEKIQSLAKELGKTPALTQIIEKYGGGFAGIIHNRYGGYIKLVKMLGMKPLPSSHNPTYSRKYFVDRGIVFAKEGKMLIPRQLFSTNEERSLLKYFKSSNEWILEVYRRLRATVNRKSKKNGNWVGCKGKNCKNKVYIRPHNRGRKKFCSHNCAYSQKRTYTIVDGKRKYKNI